MKELTKYSRVAGYLEKLYDKLNEDFFDGVLTRPVITIMSSSRAFGHYTLYDAWSIKGEGFREINISSAYLNRPIEDLIGTIVHEMCHQWNREILGTVDVSRGNTYHNKFFRMAAENHGLIVSRTEKYGWSHTKPSSELISWCIENEVQEIPMNRTDFVQVQLGDGSRTPSTGGTIPTGTTKSNSRRWVCPCCGTIIRSTRTVNVICGDCMETMVERSVAG